MTILILESHNLYPNIDLMANALYLSAVIYGIKSKSDIMHICPVMTIAKGRPFVSVSKLRFTPCLPLSVGFRPVFWTPLGELYLKHHPLITMTTR